MTRIEGSRLYLADGLRLIRRKSDGRFVGEGVDLGDEDDIGNYEEVDVTEQEAADFWRSVGVDGDPRVLDD